MIIKRISRKRYEKKYRELFKTGSGIIVFTENKKVVRYINNNIRLQLDYKVLEYIRSNTPIIAINPYENRDLVKEFGATQNSTKWPFEIIIDRGKARKIKMPIYYMTVAMDYMLLERNRRKELNNE